MGCCGSSAASEQSNRGGAKKPVRREADEGCQKSAGAGGSPTNNNMVRKGSSPKPNLAKFIPTGKGHGVAGGASNGVEPTETTTANTATSPTAEKHGSPRESGPKKPPPKPVADQYSNNIDERKPMTEHAYQMSLGPVGNEEIPKVVIVKEDGS